MNIYVSNLGSHVGTEKLKELFATYGRVTSAKIITDRATNKSRGFAFIEMADRREGEKAVKDLNGFYFEGQLISISEAKGREEKPVPARKEFANFWK